MTTAADFENNHSEQQNPLTLIKGLGDVGLGDDIMLGEGGIIEEAEAFHPIEPLPDTTDYLTTTIAERFAEYCAIEGIKPSEVSDEDHTAFATQTHAFVVRDVVEWHTANHGPTAASKYTLVPQALLTNHLEKYYREQDATTGDRIKLKSHRTSQDRNMARADHFAYVYRFAEVHVVNQLLKDFREHSLEQAAATLEELKTVYGMALGVIHKGKVISTQTVMTGPDHIPPGQ